MYVDFNAHKAGSSGTIILHVKDVQTKSKTFSYRAVQGDPTSWLETVQGFNLGLKTSSL